MCWTHRVQLAFKHYERNKTHKDCYGKETDISQHLTRQITWNTVKQDVC